MARRKYAVCFIDDQEDEIARFRQELGERFTVGAGTSIDMALNDLKKHGRSKPDLFLVDLYFSAGPSNVPDPSATLNRARADLLAAEANFYSVLAQLRQTPDEGFRMARELRGSYSQPVVIFTRKGTLDNAIRAYEDEKVSAVIKKPDPPIKQEEIVPSSDLAKLYDEAFANEADHISSAIESVIRRSTWWAKHRTVMLGIAASFFVGVVSSLAVSLSLAL